MNGGDTDLTLTTGTKLIASTCTGLSWCRCLLCPGVTAVSPSRSIGKVSEASQILLQAMHILGCSTHSTSEHSESDPRMTRKSTSIRDLSEFTGSPRDFMTACSDRGRLGGVRASEDAASSGYDPRGSGASHGIATIASSSIKSATSMVFVSSFLTAREVLQND